MIKSNREKQSNYGVNDILSIAVIILLGALATLFLILYVKANHGFIKIYSRQITVIGIGIIATATALSVVFQLCDRLFVYRLLLTFLLLFAIILAGLYILQITGFWQKISTVDSLRLYIQSLGNIAIIVTIIIHILQVVILPVPGIISIGASVALFGVLKGAIISYIGVFLGSLSAYFIGKKLGVKAVSWIVGKDSLKNVQNMLKNKDKFFITLMFLLPFFPDDILCFVSGLSSIKPKYFVIMIACTRLISIFFTAFTLSGKIIPFNTTGMILFGILFLIVIGFSYYIYNKSDKITFKIRKNHII